MIPIQLLHLQLHDGPAPSKILETELSKRALKYTHFELKSIVTQENKFPRLIQDLWLFYITSSTILAVLRLSAAFENT